MPSLAEVARAVFPTAVRRRPGGPRDDRPVGWVRVLRARIPAFDALETGDLVISPEGALRAAAPDPSEARALVEELARTRVAGLLFVGEGRGEQDEVATAASSHADRLGLAVFRLESGEASDLERTTIGYLVNQRAEIDRQTGRLEAQLHALALQGRGLEAMVAAIAAFLGRAVAVEAVDGAPLAVHVPPAAATVASAATYLAGGRAAQRTALPGGAGTLALLGETSTSELERAAAERVGAILALELEREAERRLMTDRGPAGHRLPGEGPPWIALLVRPRAPVADPAAVSAAVRRLAPARRLLVDAPAEGATEIRGLVGARDPAAAYALAARLANVLDADLGTSAPFAEAVDRRAPDEQARAALDAASAARWGGPLARAALVPAYRLVAGLRLLPDGERQAALLLAPLLAGSERSRRARLRTLEAALTHPSLGQAAEALGIHRNTLAYRLARIESLTGWRLDDPRLRFALGLALEIVQKDEERLSMGASRSACRR